MLSALGIHGSCTGLGGCIAIRFKYFFLELQQNGLQDTTQVVRQLEVQVPNTAGGTPATSNTCLRLKVRKTFSYMQNTPGSTKLF